VPSDIALLLTPEKGTKGTFTLYEDDGVTNAYLHGAYTETICTLDGMHLSVKYCGAPRRVTLCVPVSARVKKDGWSPSVIGESTKVLQCVIILSGSAEYDL
jgi:hypothetical protein